MNLDHLLKTAFDMQASDVHISVGLPPIARIHGKLTKLTDQVLVSQDTVGFAKQILKENDVKTLQAKGETDCSYTLDTGTRFRVNVFRQKGSFAIVLRLINSKIPTIEELKLPTVLKQLARKQRGLILVTGPTGSGKSTTLASMIGYMNTNMSRHVVTIEDPIEYLHQHGQCIVNQREVGSDTMTFANALRAALREDPDVIQVGEMRDLETISTAVTAAETGHLVLSTLHTVGAAKTIDRILDSFPPEQQQQIKVQLATVIEAVISQQIMPRIDKKGRIAAFEIMIATPAIRNLIREGKTHQMQTIIQTSMADHMQTMDGNLLDLYRKGIINMQTLLQYSVDTEYVREQAGQ